MDTAKPLKSAKSQRHLRRENFCALAEILRFSGVNRRFKKFRSKGFTLIEIMAATAILALGIVLVFKAFLSSADAFDYYYRYLALQPWMDEKIWSAQDDLSQYAKLVNSEPSGVYSEGAKDFYWNLSTDLIGQSKNLILYRVALGVRWQRGMRKIQLIRQAYSLYAKKE